MSRRHERAAPPPPEGGFDVRFARKTAAEGWEELCKKAPGPMRDAWEYLSTRPYRPINPSRQHPLRGSLANIKIGPDWFAQWQYEVLGGSRIWFAADEPKRLTWVTHAAVAHPSKTDR